jgi:hypothetical protein
MIDVSADDVYVVFLAGIQEAKNVGVFESVKLADEYIFTQVEKGYVLEHFTVQKWLITREAV